jgi:hypothetical protein
MKEKLLTALKGLRPRTRWLLTVFGVLVIATIITGTDNVAGIILGYMATLVIMAEWTRRWRKIRHFVLLAVVSLAGVIFLSFIHEVVAYPLAFLLLGSGAEQSGGWEIFHVVVSALIAFVGGVGLFIGIAGAIGLAAWRLATSRKKSVTA